MKIEHINPPTLHRNPAFTQVVTSDGPSKWIHVGGQNAVDASGIRLGIYIVRGHDPREGFAAAQEVWGAHPTAITVLLVAGLGNPHFLVEIEATATTSL